MLARQIRIEEAFALADADNDGTISLAELTVLSNEMLLGDSSTVGGEHSKLVADSLAKADADGNGVLDFGEFQTLMRRVSSSFGDDELMELFRRADIDRSGTIEFAEFLQMQLKRGRRLRRARELSIPVAA